MDFGCTRNEVCYALLDDYLIMDAPDSPEVSEKNSELL